jgi:hypothetical protein
VEEEEEAHMEVDEGASQVSRGVGAGGHNNKFLKRQCSSTFTIDQSLYRGLLRIGHLPEVGAEDEEGDTYIRRRRRKRVLRI